MAKRAKKSFEGWIVPIVVALIGAIAIVFAAWWQDHSKPTPDKDKYIGRVTDSRTGDRIRGAKVSLEGKDVPPVIYTDSEGVFSFPLKKGADEVRVSVEANGYEKFDLRVSPTANSGMEDIRLRAIQPPPVPTPQSTPLPVSKRQPKSGGSSTSSSNRKSNANRHDEAINVLLGKKPG